MAATFVGFEPYKLSGVKTTDHVYGHGSYATVIELDYMGLKCAGKKIHELLLMQGNSTYTVQRFEEECHILSRMHHPNVVQFLGIHFEKGARVPILVMEFLPFNLSDCIELYGVLPDEISYSILHNVANGLCYLHNQVPPIIHRDLSSNNVLLTRDMTAKISDLGVARILDLPYHQLSRMTQTPGTPAFMPPEVMVAKPKYNKNVDVFSFGIMMVHIFSGKWPEPQIGPIRTEAGRLIPVSEAERREEFLQIIGNEHPLMDLIHTCIHNDPTMRTQTNELVSRLADLVKMHPSSFANQLDILKHMEIVQKRMKQEVLAQVEELGNEIERLKQQNSELIEQNRMLLSEKDVLMKQVARDEEAMISTITLLKHTIEQKQYHLNNESPCSVQTQEDLNQKSQPTLTSSSNQNIDKQEATATDSANSAQPTSDSVKVPDIEKQTTVKEPETEKQNSSWITKHVSKALGLLTPKSHVSTQLSTSGRILKKFTTVTESKDDLDNEWYTHESVYHDGWEVDHSSVAITEKIGEGFFCKSYKGILNGTDLIVIRTPKLGEFTAIHFKEEVAIMKQLSGHPNIIKLYGTCLSKEPFYLIAEFMQHGTLYQFLHQEKQSLWTNFPKATIDMSTQIANGMAHMERWRCIHRNLSSHTILVGENLVVKVANFSCAKKLESGQDTFDAPSNEAFKPPIRQSAPEVIIDQRFSNKSDVWSFGVLLYELVTGGGVPYPEMTDGEILQQIQRDARGLQSYFHSIHPSGTNDIMRRCMEVDSANRPSFTKLHREIKRLTH